MECYISQVVYMPFSWGMVGFMPCRGQILNVSHNEALFSLLGNRFGGDGHSTFALPDLRPWADAGPDFGKKVRREWYEDEIVPHICIEGIYPSRD